MVIFCILCVIIFEEFYYLELYLWIFVFVNKNMVRLRCDMEFEIGLMCFKFYIDLGGLCEMGSIGIICFDICYKVNILLR